MRVFFYSAIGVSDKRYAGTSQNPKDPERNDNRKDQQKGGQTEKPSFIILQFLQTFAQSIVQYLPSFPKRSALIGFFSLQNRYAT
jgi:hypothetical protein